MLFEAFSIPRGRLYFLAAIFMAGTVLLLVRLWNVQVSHGQAYTNRLRDQTTVAVRLSPARGAILDRNGLPLAQNRASFDIDFYLDELVRNYSQEHRGRLPRIDVTHKVGDKTVTHRELDIYKIVNAYLEPISRSLGFAIRLDQNALRRHYAQSPTVPFPYRTDIDFTTLSQFSERNLGVPGIQIAVRPVRRYEYGAFASHILGYVGEPEENDASLADNNQPESVGRQGVEKVYDAQLQGQPGGRILQINYRGYIEREEGFTPPVVGKSLYLTLDAHIQYIVEQALRRQGRAAAVVMDPNNGDILAMASVPSFDPNDFIPRISSEKWRVLNSDPTTPLLNRAVASYAPGSTFKVVVSMAALKKGAITPETSLYCPAVYVVDGHPFHDDVDYDRGNIILHDALRVSCDTFFYQVGIRTGIDAIDDMAHTAGLGESTDFPLPEDPGLIPGPAWLKIKYPRERWTQAYTANVSIGQGAVQTSPLQMATLMCAVANNGTLYYPRLVRGVTDVNGNVVINVPTRIHGMLGVRQSDLDAIKQGLVEVVKAGTATTVQLPDVTVAGKTGTAQFNRRLNGSLVKDLRTWFYCFAPFEKPRYVVCVMVEGGVAGGVTAGPIVHDILQSIFAMEKTGQEPALTYLTPAVGNFSGVSEYVPPAPTPATPVQ